jgi:uncharacterized phage protein (TIGR02220 family)
MEGWIKLHRAILDNDLWKSEPFSRGQAWVDLLLLANHKESFFYKRGNKVIVKRGQVGRSSVELSDRWKWSRTKINKFLKDLEKEQQIITHKSSVTQLLTIVNYDVYQEKEQQTGQQKNNRKTAEVQQKDTYKNEKKEKNDKEGEERSKDIVNVIDVCAFFQSETGKRLILQKTDAKIKEGNKFKLINARIKDGASVEDCKAVIRLKNKEWKQDAYMKKYIRIQTMFTKQKFDTYLDEVINASGSTAPKKFTYQLPEFVSANQRAAYFYARLNTYRPKLDTRKFNTIYKKRAYQEKDVESLIHELELQQPELLNIKFIADAWQLTQ